MMVMIKLFYHENGHNDDNNYNNDNTNYTNNNNNDDKAGRWRRARGSPPRLCGTCRAPQPTGGI